MTSHRPKKRPAARAGTTEPDYLARYRDGDAQAFRELVDAYRERMLQFFYRLCWDRDRSEDLVQELFIKLITGSRRYRPEGRMSTFVYRVATNLWIDHYRAQRPRPRMFLYDQVVHPDGDRPAWTFAGGEEAPSDELIDKEERAAMRRALERLTEPHRLVFELAVYQERPYSEISDLLGIPVGTVKSRMHNAVQALKELMSAHPDAAHPNAARGDERSGGSQRMGGAG